jgi:hypothetical protein
MRGKRYVFLVQLCRGHLGRGHPKEEKNTINPLFLSILEIIILEEKRHE